MATKTVARKLTQKGQGSEEATQCVHPGKARPAPAGLRVPWTQYGGQLLAQRARREVLHRTSPTPRPRVGPMSRTWASPCLVRSWGRGPRVSADVQSWESVWLVVDSPLTPCLPFSSPLVPFYMPVAPPLFRNLEAWGPSAPPLSLTPPPAAPLTLAPPPPEGSPSPGCWQARCHPGSPQEPRR